MLPCCHKIVLFHHVLISLASICSAWHETSQNTFVFQKMLSFLKKELFHIWGFEVHICTSNPHLLYILSKSVWLRKNENRALTWSGLVSSSCTYKCKQGNHMLWMLGIEFQQADWPKSQSHSVSLPTEGTLLVFTAKPAVCLWIRCQGCC